MAKSYVAELQKVSVDPQYSKAEFDRNKLTMQDKITRNMKVIMDLINDLALSETAKTMMLRYYESNTQSYRINLIY